MKPWEETWRVRWDEDAGAAYVETGTRDDTVCVDDPAKAALIAAAPEMARLLREWMVEGSMPQVSVHDVLKKAGALPEET